MGGALAAQTLLDAGTQALVDEGKLQDARRWFDAAYREAELSGDASGMAVAALGLGGLWVHEHRTAATAELVQARQRAALSQVDPESALALRLRIRLAGEDDYRAAAYSGILDVLEEARKVGDPVARAEALSLAHHCVLGPDHSTLRRDLAAELIGESAHTRRRSDLLMGLLWQTVDLFLDGDPHAERRLGELRALLAGREHHAVGFVVAAMDVMLHIRAGRFAEAETLAARCAERGADAGDADAPAWYGAQLVTIRWFQGRIAELVPMLTELVHSPTLSAVDNSYFAALAVAAATAGDHRQAAGALARLRGRDLAELPRSSSWLVSMCGVAEAAYLLSDAETAARVYELLSPYANRPVMASLAVTCFGSAQHALGVAALTTGALDRAVEHLQAAVHANLAVGHWPAATLARSRLARALVERAGPADTAAARQELATAVEEAAGLKMALPADRRSEPAVMAVCHRAGRQWRVELGTRVAVVEHSVGMLHLAVLMANPGHELPAVDLAAGAGIAGSSAQPVLDGVARHEYRRRLSRLRLEIDEFEARNELQRAESARAEVDWLVAELAAATGIGGRARRFPDSEERARIAVGKAIRRAIGRIIEAEPAVGEHLRSTVFTGLRCSYRPE